MLAARILDSTGSYDMSYIVSAVLLVIASVFTFAPKHGKAKQQQSLKA